MTSITAIQELFPHPSCLDDYIYDSYCVGGALCATANMYTRFPSIQYLAQAMCVLNDTLVLANARTLAKSLIDHNDNARFALAWDIAKQALEYRP